MEYATAATATQKEQPDSDMEKLRIWVAELLNRRCEYHNEVHYSGFALTKRCVIPDYPSDLNACHEFEEQFRNDCAIWMDYMALLVGKPWHFAWEADEVWGAVHATAEQRCRAFVATMEASSVREGTEKQVSSPSSSKSDSASATR
jgi:hypothetical protein